MLEKKGLVTKLPFVMREQRVFIFSDIRESLFSEKIPLTVDLKVLFELLKRGKLSMMAIPQSLPNQNKTVLVVKRKKMFEDFLSLFPSLAKQYYDKALSGTK